MMGKNNASMICQTIGIFLHAFLCYQFVWVNELEIKGIGYASTVTNSIVFTLLCLYSYFLKDIREAVQLPTSQVYTNIYQYL